MIEAELKGHTHSVTAAALSQDNSKVASGSDDKTIWIWNVTTGRVEVELKGHADYVTSIAFSQDDSRVVAGSGKTVQIWNAITGKVKAKLKGHTSFVTSVAFSQDGSKVVTASDDKTVRIWDVTTSNAQVMTELSITLPDGSIINKVADAFYIVYPLQQPTPIISPVLSVSEDKQWIVGALHDCWIPSFYRNFTSFSCSGSRLCLGYESGRVVILDITSMVALAKQ